MSADYKAVVFDMDGTLVDSERALLETWEFAAREMGYIFSREIMMKTIGTTYNDTMRRMIETYPDAPHEDIRKVTSERFQAMRESGKIALRSGAGAALEAVSGLGLKIGLCTSTRASSAKATLESVGIYEFFDAAVYGDEITRGKPDPEPYLLVASRLGVDPAECYAVEDSPSGARSALAAGMAVAFVPDILSAPEDVADKITIIDNLTQVISLLGK